MMPRTVMLSHLKIQVNNNNSGAQVKETNPVPTGATFKKWFTNILLYFKMSEPRRTRMTLVMPRNLPNPSESRRIIKILEPLMFLNSKKIQVFKIWYAGKMKQTNFHWNCFKTNSLIYFCTPICPSWWRQRCYQGAHRTSPSSDEVTRSSPKKLMTKKWSV